MSFWSASSAWPGATSGTCGRVMPSTPRAGLPAGRQAVARIDNLLIAAFKGLPPKPPDTAVQALKRRYSELMSAVIANALGEELRARGMEGARPAGPGEAG